MKLRETILAAALLALAVVPTVQAAGPAIDWDPAYGWQAGGTPTNLPLGGEFKMVGVISGFDVPLQELNALDPTKEYTFYVHNLISGGTVASGTPTMTFYETYFAGGTIEVYEDLSPDASFDPNPPNAGVPSDFIDGTMILSGNFSRFVVQSNNFTVYKVGNIEGDITWTGGTMLDRFRRIGGEICPGLYAGGSTWNTSVVPAGYLFRHDGKIDLQCPTPTTGSTWGRIKSLYR
ncbi:MAG: hypothetical protein ABIU54_09285 [Candidatus Eisenbacteria bacterium]